jgi:hypothetical protein
MAKTTEELLAAAPRAAADGDLGTLDAELIRRENARRETLTDEELIERERAAMARPAGAR